MGKVNRLVLIITIALIPILSTLAGCGEKIVTEPTATSSESLLTATSNNPLYTGLNNPLAASSGGMIVYRAFPASVRDTMDCDFIDSNDTDYFTSELVLFPYLGNRNLRDFLKCQGQLLNKDHNIALFSLLGTTYGGDGKTNFAIPNLNEKSPLDGLTYHIEYQWGIYPVYGDDKSATTSAGIRYFAFRNVALNNYFLGEILLAKNVDEKAYAGTILPCDGRELKINDNPALYSLIGPVFGQSSPVTFKLPDMSGVKSPVDGAKYYIIVDMLNSKFPNFEN